MEAPMTTQHEPLSDHQNASSVGGYATTGSDPNAPHDNAQRDDGTSRATIDHAAAERAGFSPRQPMFARGTTQDDSHANGAAHQSRIAFDKQPLVVDYCRAFVERIASERRADVEVRATDLRMSPRNGFLFDTSSKRWSMSDRGFKTLVTRLGIGGAGYLVKCWPELRAHNFNQWTEKLRDAEDEMHEQSVRARSLNSKLKPYEPRSLMLRTRSNPNSSAREVFGVVTPSYTAFDVDRIAQALAIATPADARGRVSYDGRRARFDVLFHTTRTPSEFVSGEFFRAGVSVRGEDTGGNSIVMRAFVDCHLCNNMIMIDRSAKEVVRLQHRGSVKELAVRFKNGFAAALNKLDHFLVAWGYAQNENVIERSQSATTETIPLSAVEALPGLFNGILDRDIVPIRGKARDIVPVLVSMWRADTSSDAGRCNRAAIVNAITRYAHEVESDPVRTDEIQNAASALLFGRGDRQPNPLPYLAIAA